jgi:lipopolysaccharide assembly protein A
MRFLQATLLIAFLAAVAAFALQNNALVEVQFLAWGFKAPQAVVIVGVYLLGMISGGAVFGFVRRSLRRVSEPPKPRKD